MKKNQQLPLNFDDSPKEEVKKPSDKKIQFQRLGSELSKYKLEDKGGYITQEFQDFGYRMALELDDVARTSLYMRLAKSTNRGTLEQALSFVADAPNVKSKARLFMWKLKEIKNSKTPQPASDSTPSSTDKT